MMLMPIKLGLGGSVGRGNQWFSWIHVHDLIRGMAHVWQLHDAGKSPQIDDAFNFTAPQTVMQKEFNRIAAQVLHRPNWPPLPGIFMRLPLGEQADLLLEGQRVTPQKLTASGFTFHYPDLRLALENLK